MDQHAPSLLQQGVVRRVATACRRALPPLAVAGLLAALGRRRAVFVLIGVAALLLIVGLVLPTAAARLDRFVARLATRIGNGLSTVIAAVAWVLIVLPLWAASRLVRLSPLDTGWTSVQSAWIRVPRGPDDERQRVRRLSSAELPLPVRTRRRQRVRLMVLIAPLVLLAAGIGLNRMNGSGSGSGSDPGSGPDALQIAGLPVTDYAHENEPWFEDYAVELNRPMNLWDPYVGTTLRDLDGEYLNIVDGRRATFQPNDPDVEIWYFGGSTMFGMGQRDMHTIPSIVSKLALEDGIRIRSTNFGVSSFVNWQGVELMEQALTLGPAPDLIVFYDGVNEQALAYQRLQLNDADPDAVARQLIDDAERELFTNGRGNLPIPNGDFRSLEVDLAAQQYRRGVELSTRLAESFDVPIIHFWQPTFTTKVPSPADEPLVERLGLSSQYRADADSYLQILEDSGTDAIDLSDALDHVEVPVYFDWAHTNELGAKIVAETLYRDLRPQLLAAREPTGPPS